jgi:hypothetical protein
MSTSGCVSAHVSNETWCSSASGYPPIVFRHRVQCTLLLRVNDYSSRLTAPPRTNVTISLASFSYLNGGPYSSSDRSRRYFLSRPPVRDCLTFTPLFYFYSSFLFLFLFSIVPSWRNTVTADTATIHFCISRSVQSYFLKSPLTGYLLNTRKSTRVHPKRRVLAFTVRCNLKPLSHR